VASRVTIFKQAG